MKIFMVLLLCLWLESTEASQPILPCACARIPTMVRSSSMQPIDIIWPGKCFQMSHPYISEFRWSRLVKNGQHIYGLTKAFEINSCQDQMKDMIGGLCPRIISRREWGARKPKKTTPLSTPVKYAVVHHSDTPQCLSEDACKRRIQSIQNYHMDTRGWDDIGYNFLIGGDGNIYEGRGWDTMGAHVRGYNNVSIGICVIGDYMHVKPNTGSVNALKAMLGCLRSQNKVKADYLLRGHRDLGSTSCPGNELYNIIKHWPHY